MSFGKNAEHLKGVAVYGGTTTQRASNASRKKKRSGGGGGNRPYWADGFRPHETRADTVRLIPGDYLTQRVEEDVLTEEKTPWYEFLEHFNASVRRGAICSGGPHRFNKNKRGECEGCGVREVEQRGNRSMSSSDKYGFRVIDMGLFHRVPQVDRKSGQVRANKDGEPYTEWVKCSGRGCANCQTALEHRYGYIQPWIMGKQHFNALNGYGAGIGTCCVTCTGRGTIQSISWYCANPACHSVVIDMATSTLSDEQLGEMTSKPITCGACHSETYLTELISCTNCTPAGAAPVRATIFDVDLTVQAPRTGENDSTVLQVVGMTDPKPLDPVFEDLVKFAPDLAKKFAPTPLDEQRSLWKMQASAPSNLAQPGVQPAVQPGMPAAAAPMPMAPGMPPQPGMPTPAVAHTVDYGAQPVQQAVPVAQPAQAVPMAQPPAQPFNSMPTPGAPPGPAVSHPPVAQPAPVAMAPQPAPVAAPLAHNPALQPPVAAPAQPAYPPGSLAQPAYPPGSLAQPAPVAPVGAPAPVAQPLAPPAGGYLPPGQ